MSENPAEAENMARQPATTSEREEARRCGEMDEEMKLQGHDANYNADSKKEADRQISCETRSGRHAETEMEGAQRRKRMKMLAEKGAGCKRGPTVALTRTQNRVGVGQIDVRTLLHWTELPARMKTGLASHSLDPPPRALNRNLAGAA